MPFGASPPFLGWGLYTKRPQPFLCGQLRRTCLLRAWVKIGLAAAHFHSVGVARAGPWNTWVNRGGVFRLDLENGCGATPAECRWSAPRSTGPPAVAPSG